MNKHASERRIPRLAPMGAIALPRERDGRGYAGEGDGAAVENQTSGSKRASNPR